MKLIPYIRNRLLDRRLGKMMVKGVYTPRSYDLEAMIRGAVWGLLAVCFILVIVRTCGPAW
jgi:hypothetical protein